MFDDDGGAYSEGDEDEVRAASFLKSALEALTLYSSLVIYPYLLVFTKCVDGLLGMRVDIRVMQEDDEGDGDGDLDEDEEADDDEPSPSPPAHSHSRRGPKH